MEKECNGESVFYTYDKAGKRILKNDAHGEVRYFYNEKNQLLSQEDKGEMADITFTYSLCILIDVLIASPQEVLKLSNAQLEAYTSDFVSRLLEHLRNSLNLQRLSA